MQTEVNVIWYRVGGVIVGRLPMSMVFFAKNKTIKYRFSNIAWDE